MTEKNPNDENHFDEFSLIEHLADLRSCIINTAYILIGGFGACYYFSDKLFEVLRAPVIPYLQGSSGLHFLSIQEKFVAHLKVSFLAGVMLTSPLWLHQVWRFVAPGLYAKEKKYLFSFVISGGALFCSGVAFVHYFVLPKAFEFLIGFGGNTDIPMITIDYYMDFVFKFYLAFGLTFEMPLIMTFLGMMGVINAQMLRAVRRYAILIMAIFAAVVTPPDALSMMSLLIPMLGLYELSILLVKVFEKS